jgi:hypothetical protein
LAIGRARWIEIGGLVLLVTLAIVTGVLVAQDRRART